MSGSGVLERTADVAGAASGDDDDDGGGGGSRKIVLWLIALVLVPVVIFAGYTMFLTMVLGSRSSDCAPGAQPGEPADASASAMANAKLIYSVFSAWGAPDENIAGILGNFDPEGGIDPTAVEGIFDERFQIGPRKQAAWDANFTGFGYGDYSVEFRGIGLGQWTNGRNQALLAYARALGQPWHHLEVQLGFMISPAEGGNADIVRELISTSKGSPQAAAIYFHDKWERSADDSTAVREASAARWMGLISGWGADRSLAQKILDQSGSTLGDPGASAAGSGSTGCGTSTVVGQAAFPLKPGYQMTSGYGSRDLTIGEYSSDWHPALDLQNWPNPCGDPVYAVLPGTVTLSSELFLTIKHQDGYLISYLHMHKSERLVDVGDQVSTGEQIGLVGNVPPSSGCHLDLRINKNGTTNPAVAALQEAPALGGPARYAGYVNPEDFLRLFGLEICPSDSCRRL